MKLLDLLNLSIKPIVQVSQVTSTQIFKNSAQHMLFCMLDSKPRIVCTGDYSPHSAVHQHSFVEFPPGIIQCRLVNGDLPFLLRNCRKKSG